MKISTRGRYALRMLLDMAQNQDAGCVSLKDIAERQAISKKYLEQIALVLSQNGILRGSRGHMGGYHLVGTPADYTVADIMQAMEGSMAPVSCLEESPNACPRCGECQTLPVWAGLDQLINRYLSSITLQDIMDGKVTPPENM